jgi:predicted transporter
MAIEDLIYPVGEAIGLLINAVLRELGFSEIKTEKIVNIIAYSFLAIFVLGLFYITFKYS